MNQALYAHMNNKRKMKKKNKKKNKTLGLLPIKFLQTYNSLQNNAGPVG
jgi:hypothetical protein